MRYAAVICLALVGCYEPRSNPLDPSGEKPSLDVSIVDGAVVVKWDRALAQAPALAGAKFQLDVKVTCPDKDASRSACQPATVDIAIADGEARYVKPWPGGEKTVDVVLKATFDDATVDLAAMTAASPDWDGDGALETDCDDSTRSDACSGSSSCVESGGSIICDLNECATANGGCSQTCQNEVGSFKCSCREGYKLNADGKECEDVDECGAATNPCGTGTCASSTDGYSCTCPSGYSVRADGKACEDLNECATANGRCSQTCQNEVGSFKCSCREGYRLNADGRGCDDVDECSAATNPCGTGACANSTGGYSCTCPTGYSVRADGNACEDVNECATNNGGCSAGEICTNLAGGRSCDVPVAGALITKTIANVAFEFSYIPAGTFTMGSPTSDPESYFNERPQFAVTLTKPFLLLRNEVSQAQYQAVMGTNPSNFRGETLPVELVSWSDAVAFCTRLEQLEGVPSGTYGLPTEAQWEYGARAGTTTPRYGLLDSIAWYSANSGNQTKPVRVKQANAWHLYDMLGNVWEWTADWYGAYGASAQTDPTGPSTGSNRVYRGGGWVGGARIARAGIRFNGGPADRYDSLGFRPRRSLP